MTHGKRQEPTIDQLVERYAAIGIAQDEALLMNEIAKFNRAELPRLQSEVLRLK